MGMTSNRGGASPLSKSNQSRPIERASMSSGPDLQAESDSQAQFEAAARMLGRGDERALAAFADGIASAVRSGDTASLERFNSILQLAEGESPGIAGQVLDEARRLSSAEVASPVADAEVVADQKPAANGNRFDNYSALEQYRTYGVGKDPAKVNGKRPPGAVRVPGLADLMNNSMEDRSRSQRAEEATESGRRQAEVLASSRGYRALRDEQLGRLEGMPLSPEAVATLDPAQASKMLGIPAAELTPEAIQSLIGAKLTPEQARVLSRKQRDALTGSSFMNQGSMTDSQLQALEAMLAKGGDEYSVSSDQAAERHANLSTIDQLLAALRANSERLGRGESVELNPDRVTGLKQWRYPFPTSQDGQIVRPQLAPSGEFMARTIQPYINPKKPDNAFVAMAAPVLDKAIRQYAETPPLNETFRGMKGRTPLDFATMLLEPFRGGVDLKKAEQSGWPFPQYMEGQWINRGTPKPNLDLGGLLIDAIESAPRPEATISTPEEGMPTPPPEAPITPAQGDVGAWDPRSRGMAALAALLA